jgi:RND family efflux transporter MFP subunit
MGVLKRAGWSLNCVAPGLALGCALVVFETATPAGVPAAPSTEPKTYTTPSDFPARTRFILTRKLSADRLGVMEMTPEEGEYVTAGTIIAKLKDDVAEAAVASAAAKAASDAEILAADKLAESERLEATVMEGANRNSKSLSTPTYTRSEIDRARLRAEAADLQTGVKRNEKHLAGLELAQAQAELKTYQIMTPIDGIVTQVLKRSGEGVQQGEAILEVVNTSVIRVEERIPAAIAARVHVGSPVKVRFKVGTSASGPPAPQYIAEGRIAFVDVTVESQVQNVRVWAEVPNPNQLIRGGTPAEMTITLDAAPAGLDDSNLQIVPEASSRAGSKPAN